MTDLLEKFGLIITGALIMSLIFTWSANVEISDFNTQCQNNGYAYGQHYFFGDTYCIDYSGIAHEGEFEGYCFVEYKTNCSGCRK